MWQQQQQQTYLRVLPSQHPQQQHTHHPVIGMDDRQNQRHHQHHHQQYQHHQHHRATIMDLPVPSNPRASRNMAEKQRRDNLNTNIAAMASLLPVVAGSSRRMDKISVLRLAAAFLRTQYTLGQGMTNFLPSQFNEFDLEQYFVNYLVDSSGFFIVITAIGKIIYVSRQVEQHLGHIQNELLGQSLYDFTYSEDHEELKRNLTPDGMRPISPTDAAQTPELVYDNNSSSSENSTSTHRSSENTKSFREQRRNFKIRLAQRTVSKREHTQYEWFDVSGVLRLADACRNADLNGNRGKYREKTGKNDIVFAGVATMPKKRPITELSIMDANKDEYVTRHLVDGRIIYCDHRISVIAGYMSEEVSGLNAFAFMHKDDFRWTMIGLRQMYDHAETFGSSCYRLLTKTGEFIYLRTHGYLEYDKDTHTVESFVCINTLVSEEEGNQLIKEMKGRFSATVSSTSRSLIPTEENHSTTSIELGSNSSQSSHLKCSLEDPTQLEDAITHLISDLPSPTMSDEAFSPSPLPNTQYMKAAILSSRLPPVATQLNKLSKVDRFAVIKDKRDRTLSQESEQRKHTIGKLITPSSAEQSPISDSEGVKSSGKSLSMLKIMNTVHNNHDNVQSTMSNILSSCKSSTNACMSHNHTSFVDTSHSTNALHEDTMCNIKLERDTETFNCLPKQEPLLQYFDDSASDSSIVSSGIVSPGIISPRIETHNRCALKRICSDEDISIYSKKRTNDEYNNDEHQSAFHLKLRTITAKNNPTLSVGFQQCNTNSQPLMTAESPSSSLQEVGTDYQQLVVDPLIMTHSDEEQFTDLQDLKDDPLLSPHLAATPDLMMKIFDGLHNESVMGFEISGGCNEAKAQQSIPDDQAKQQAVNDELRRTYCQLATSMALRESEINVLARDLENPALRAQRKNLSQLQAEHNMQKQMLRTLQNDHHKMQASAKPNLEV